MLRLNFIINDVDEAIVAVECTHAESSIKNKLPGSNEFYIENTLVSFSKKYKGDDYSKLNEEEPIQFEAAVCDLLGQLFLKDESDDKGQYCIAVSDFIRKVLEKYIQEHFELLDLRTYKEYTGGIG